MAFFIGRYVGRERLEYECEVVTPLFLGGADPKSAELRAASVKGVLRFWWRALYGGDDIEDMRKRESMIFGSTEQKSLLKVQISPITINYSNERLSQGFSTIEYLAYGYIQKDKTIRNHIKPGSRFKIFLDLINCPELNEVTNAMKFLLSYSGIGSRSRNAFGSLFCKNAEIDYKVFKKDDKKHFISKSASMQLKQFSIKSDWKQAMTEMGDSYKNARYVLKQEHMNRGMIGLPFGSESDFKRYAKSFFMHISKLDNRYRGQILYMPHIYALEAKKMIHEKVNNRLFEIVSGGAR